MAMYYNLNMYYVYIIQSLQDGKLYYGYTRDLRRRFQEHNSGKSNSTRYRRPFRLIYYEAYRDERDAIIRERSLKKFGQGIYRLKDRLKYSLE